MRVRSSWNVRPSLMPMTIQLVEEKTRFLNALSFFSIFTEMNDKFAESYKNFLFCASALINLAY